MKAIVNVVASLAFAICACGPAGPSANAPVAKPPHPGVLHYYPLEDGMQWMYVVHDRVLEGGLLASTKVVLWSGGEAVLQTGKDQQHLRVVPDGIIRDPAGGYLLKWPIHAGDRWPTSEGASMQVTSVDTAITTEAGAFTECVATVES